MGMEIYNNLAALNTLNVMNSNTKQSDKAANQTASGMKFTGAKFYASEYNISEKMRVKLRGLEQCGKNTATGITMLDTATSGVQEQIEILKQVRARAMQASDDTYTETDRKALQDEISQLLDEVDDISHLTNHNGISLLDQSSLNSITKKFIANTSLTMNTNTVIPQSTNATFHNTSVYAPTLGDYVAINPSLSNVYGTNVVAGNAYSNNLPSVGNVVCDANGNYGVVKQDASGTLYFNNGSGDIVIEVAGMTNGTQATGTTTNIYIPRHPQLTSMPSVGDKVCSSASVTIQNGTVRSDTIYTVAVEPWTNTLSYFNTSSSISEYPLDFSTLFTQVANVPADLDGQGFSLDCAGCDQFVSILFDASTNSSFRHVDEDSQMSPKPIGYVIGIAGVTDEQSLLQAIFDGIGNENKVLSADSVEVASVHDLHIDRYLQQNGDYIYVVSKNGPQIGLINGVKGEFIDTSGYLPEKNIGLQTETRSNEQVSVTLPNTTLSILYPQSNNTWSISPSDDDYPQPWPTNYETLYEKYSKTTENPFDFTTWAKKHWTETVWPYPANTIEYDLDDCVSTKEKAAKFIDDTDQALKYLLRSSTKLGAQVSRLDFTADVLTVKNENLTQSESVIRDADMAQSISDKLKYDTLLKASQSMLAQANQQMQSILQFLE